MTEYTSEQLATMMETYRVCAPHLAFIRNIGSIRKGYRSTTLQSQLRIQKDIRKVTSYLLRNGIPQMRETIPEGALERLGINLPSLEDTCKELDSISSDNIENLKKLR